MKKTMLTLMALLLASQAYAYNINVESEGKTQVINLTPENPEQTIYFGNAYNYNNEIIHDGNTLILKLDNDKLNIITSYQTIKNTQFSADANPYNEDDTRAQLDDSLNFVNQYGTHDQKIMYKQYYDNVTTPELQTLTIPSVSTQTKYQKLAIEEIKNLNVSVNNKTPQIKLSLIK
jgi:hypothetical protein